MYGYKSLTKISKKALREAENIISYARHKTANFNINLNNVIVGYTHKDTIMIVNKLLDDEFGKSDIQVYFRHKYINKAWKNAELRVEERIIHNDIIPLDLLKKENS